MPAPCKVSSPYSAHRWGRVGSNRVCLDCDLPEPEGPHRPAGFMTLGTPRNKTMAVRVVEVAAFYEHETGGVRLVLQSGQVLPVRESLAEVADAMNAETTKEK